MRDAPVRFRNICSRICPSPQPKSIAVGTWCIRSNCKRPIAPGRRAGRVAGSVHGETDGSGCGPAPTTSRGCRVSDSLGELIVDPVDWLYERLWRLQNAASSSCFSVNRGLFQRSESSHMSDPLTFSAAFRSFKTSSRIRGRAPNAAPCAFVSRMSTARRSASRRSCAASFRVHSRQRGSSHLQPFM